MKHSGQKAPRPPVRVGLLFACSLCLLSGCQTDESPTPNPASDATALSSGWNLVFEDDFNGGLSSWNVWNGGAYNNEIQMYRGNQVIVSEGTLKIIARREAVSGPANPNDATVKKFEYVSGRVESRELFGPDRADGGREYRFTARIKLPSGHGMWPAFWTYGDPWPTAGEVDILEARGGEPDVFQSNIFYGTKPGVNINRGTEKVHPTGRDLTAGFHIYEMIWRQGSIDILFDGELIHTYTASRSNNIRRMFGKKQKVVLNTAVGGWFFQDQNSGNYADGSVMEIDWVRVYKR